MKNDLRIKMVVKNKKVKSVLRIKMTVKNKKVKSVFKIQKRDKTAFYITISIHHKNIQ